MSCFKCAYLLDILLDIHILEVTMVANYPARLRDTLPDTVSGHQWSNRTKGTDPGAGQTGHPPLGGVRCPATVRGLPTGVQAVGTALTAQRREADGAMVLLARAAGLAPRPAVVTDRGGRA